MKRISKNRIEFDCIVKSCSAMQTSIEDGDKVEMFIHYFDKDDDINLVMKGHYTSEHLKKLDQASRNMEVVKIIIEVKDKDEVL